MENHSQKYDDEFKRVSSACMKIWKTQSQLAREYEVSLSALSRWIKLFSEVRLDQDTIIVTPCFEEENLILKKPLPYLRKTQAMLRRCSYFET